MNKILVIDIGNTATKLCLFNKSTNEMVDSTIVLTQVFKNEANKIVEEFYYKDYEEVVVGSVVLTADDAIKNAFKNKKIIHMDSKKFENLISTNEHDPIGQDIIAFSYFLIKKNYDCVGVCFGSATFAVIVQNKKLCGCMIAPSFINSFYDFIKKAEFIDNNETINFKNRNFSFYTNDALCAGYYHMCNGFLESIFNFAVKKRNINNFLIAGGNSYEIKKIDFINSQYKIEYNDIFCVSYGYYYLYKDFIENKAI